MQTSQQNLMQLLRAASNARTAERNAAFNEIVLRFQDMAFGLAYARLGDFALAQDAAQEAFVTAWRHLDQLRTPEAFPGWFQRIVVTQCHRMTRNRRGETVPFDELRDIADEKPGPFEILIRKETRQETLFAVASLPERERIAVTLYYIAEYSTAEIAAFLEVPITTIKKRLYSARQRLKERIMNGLDALPDALQEKRPSNTEDFAATVAVFNAALDSFVTKVKTDRNIIAIILMGSLSYDKVWKRSDIDIILIAKTDKEKGRSFCLVENGVNIHASLAPRNQFRKSLDGGLQGEVRHSAFSRSTLLYTTDDSIREYYDNLDKLGAHDRDSMLLSYGNDLQYLMAKIEKWHYVKKDIEYTFQWLLYAVMTIAKAETILQGRIPGREVIQQALQLNPAFFRTAYIDFIHGPKTEATMQIAIDRVNNYIEERMIAFYGLVIEYLQEADSTRTTTELNEYFKRQSQQDNLAFTYEYLADRGILHKIPCPVRLTDKSAFAAVDEAAYCYDPVGAAAVALKAKKK